MRKLRRMSVVDDFPVLPRRQKETLLFILRFWRQERVMPTLREISAGIKLSSSNPQPYIRPLITKGYLHRGPTATRLLRISEQAFRWESAQPEPEKDLFLR